MLFFNITAQKGVQLLEETFMPNTFIVNHGYHGLLPLVKLLRFLCLGKLR